MVFVRRYSQISNILAHLYYNNLVILQIASILFVIL